MTPAQSFPVYLVDHTAVPHLDGVPESALAEIGCVDGDSLVRISNFDKVAGLDIRLALEVLYAVFIRVQPPLQ
jgi:hypothetical protein